MVTAFTIYTDLGGEGGTSYNGLYGEAPPEKSTSLSKWYIKV